MNRSSCWILGLLVGLIACAKADGNPPALAQPSAPVVRAVLVPGDTLGYAVTWGAVSAATTYDFTVSVTATNGTWTATFGSTAVGALPALGNTAAPGPVVVKLMAIPWDSATFTFAYRARHVPARSALDTSAFVGTTWKAARRLGTPLPPTVTPDTATVKVTGALVMPNAATLTLAGSRDFCAFQVFGNGAITRFSNSSTHCDSIYQRTVPAFERSLVTSALQAHTDSLAKSCPTWTWDALHLSATPAACIAALTVTAIQTTGLSPQQRQRYAAWNAAYGTTPALTVDQHGLVTCHHPGLGIITVSAEGIAHSVELACSWPTPLQIAVRPDAAAAGRAQ